ncbi:MAG TPA: transposase [Tenuifilaceae bacterium]|nr:transposase [Tenuifilaceae bacterium]HPI43596.1 transposase [Tenuifilaceae bacterium]HPI43599.1 transposase [Tenuifilaceae bacterium]
MSEKYKVIDTGYSYFITITLVEWQKLFHIPLYAEIITDSIRYCQKNKGLELFGYVIMPSHIHLIARAELRPLGEVMRDFKKFTATRIVERLSKDLEHQPMLAVFADAANRIKRNKNYKVWQDGFHPEVITSSQFFYQKLKYIHDNPVEAALAELPEQYPYSSARNYAELDYVLEIVFEMPQRITYC